LLFEGVHVAHALVSGGFGVLGSWNVNLCAQLLLFLICRDVDRDWLADDVNVAVHTSGTLRRQNQYGSVSLLFVRLLVLSQ